MAQFFKVFVVIASVFCSALPAVPKGNDSVVAEGILCSSQLAAEKIASLVGQGFSDETSLVAVNSQTGDLCFVAQVVLRPSSSQVVSYVRFDEGRVEYEAYAIERVHVLGFITSPRQRLSLRFSKISEWYVARKTTVAMASRQVLPPSEMTGAISYIQT